MRNYLSTDLNEDLKLFLEEIQPPYNVIEFDRLAVECEEIYLDPITNCVINFPVKLNGRTFDFDTIDMLEFNNGEARCPFSNEPFQMKKVVPDTVLNERIKIKLAQAKKNPCDNVRKNDSSMALKAKINKAIELFLNHNINGNFNLSDLDIAITDIAELASQFYPEAQYLYAVCYEIGFNVSQNSRKYVKYLRHAVEQGLGIAQLSYANCCEHGWHGVTKDVVEAAKYYELSADQDITVSLFNYGQCLALGAGVKQDLKKAAYYFKRSADKGYSKAQYNYAKCCEKGYGIAINLSEADKYYKLADEQGLSSNQAVRLSAVNVSSNKLMF